MAELVRGNRLEVVAARSETYRLRDSAVEADVRLDPADCRRRRTTKYEGYSARRLGHDGQSTID
jgi:hypothetical protein